MELAPLLVVLALAVLVVAYIVRPLREGSAREPDARERRLSALRAEQDQTLALLHELDMDYAMGRVEPEDYQLARAVRVGRGADILREIDEITAQAAPPGATLPAAMGTSELEARIAQLRVQAGGFCGNCGSPLALGDRFCSRCGHPAPGAGN
jgi:hypothetical protein